jgi:hypothetical protein
MHHRRPHPRLRSILVGCCAASLAAAGAGLGLAGCGGKQKVKLPESRYQQLEPRQVPAFLENTILAKADLLGTEPVRVSGYGLVANLAGTGNSEVPTPVREYMVKEMTKHKYGSSLIPGMDALTPARVLADPRFAIVRVDGMLPPGVRQKQTFDVEVSAVPESKTTSLAGGDLYQTDLRQGGANPMDPSASVNLAARCQGPLFVNPAYALDADTDKPEVRRSLRRASVMGGGVSQTDRPLVLRIREPQRSTARRIEARINERFQQVADRVQADRHGGLTTATAEMTDEAIVHFYVPGAYDGDWAHVAQLVTHLYLNTSPDFVARKAQELAAEAVKPNAPLGDITFCWEGLGGAALPHFRDLMNHDAPDVAFAAARAAAFLGDAAAPDALARIAGARGNPFRVNAVETLGALPASPAISAMLRPLLDADQTLVRLAAYRVLAANKDNAVFSKVIREKFVLDIVRSSGPPLIYATRTDVPRIAVIGDRPGLDAPLTFLAMGGRLSLSSDPAGRLVTIFYRGSDVPRPVRIDSRPDVAELVARLGGEGWDGKGGLHFNYGQIVGILSNLSSERKLTAVAGGTRVPAPFVLEELPGAQDAIQAAPVIPDTAGRPQADAPDAQDAPGNKVGMAN